MRNHHRLIVTLLGAAAFACGSDNGTKSGTPPPSTPASPSNFVITISGFAFAPLDLAAPPGATITVVNQDSAPHTVTSESAPGNFTPGAVNGVSFDTGAFTGQTTFTLPASAPEGTVIPYYCAVHRGGMATPNGTITIHASAQPGGALDGGSSSPAPQADGGHP